MYVNTRGEMYVNTRGEMYVNTRGFSKSLSVSNNGNSNGNSSNGNSSNGSSNGYDDKMMREENKHNTTF